MNAGDLLSAAWGNLDRRKGRTALTAAGVIIGVASLVLMVSLGLGLQRGVLSLVENEHSLRTLRVTRVKADASKKPGGGFGMFGMGGQMIPVTDQDLAQMEAVEGVEAALPVLNLFPRVTLRLGGTRHDLRILPVGGLHPREEGWMKGYLRDGALWKDPAAKSCLVPAGIVEGIPGATSASLVGATLDFASMLDDEEDAAKEEQVYTIVGTFDSDRLGMRGEQILMPLDRAKELRDRLRMGFSVFSYKKGAYFAAEVRLADPRQAEPVARRLKESGFSVLSAADMVKSINIVFLVVEGFMASIGAIGLVVSLFGIANTMAMAVLERTREIGIMKALGARNRDIGRLFLAEAGSIGLLGGIIGLTAATLLGMALNAVAHKGFDLPPNVNLFHVSYWLAGGSVAFSVAVSVLAGWLPARRAARMEPVAALRYE